MNKLKQDSTKEMQLVKSENFYDSEANFYQDSDNEMWMTIEQLSNCLGYRQRRGVEMLLKRHSYIFEDGLAVANKVFATDGKQYDTIIFSEDGIYEVCFLSTKPKAKEFRRWARGVLKGLRKGELQISQNGISVNDELINQKLNALFEINKETTTELRKIKYLVGLTTPASKFSEWKKEIGKQIRVLAKTNNIPDEKQIYNKLYIHMDSNYDAQISQHKSNYLEIINKENCPTIDVIDYYGNLRDIFETLVINYTEIFETREEIA